MRALHQSASHRRPFGAAVLALCGIASVAAEPAEYTIDPEHFSVGFLVDHVGYAKVLGMFEEASGSFTFDEETGELSNIQIAIQTDSVSTGHKKRDKHLRGKDFLNSRKFPEMIYGAGSAQALGNQQFRINGQLTLLGKGQPMTLTATWNKSGAYPFGDEHYAMGVSARGSFKRSAHGMTYAVENGWVGDEIELIIEFEAKRE